MFYLIIILLGAGALLAYFYNRLVAKLNLVREGWSGVDVQLKLRHDLIPNIVSIVKGYSKHEAETLQNVTTARSTRFQDASTLAASEQALSKGIQGVFALAEAYPDLKANSSYLDLHKQLIEVEEKIQYARRYYNGCVRDYNILIETVPSNLFAKLFSFTPADFFELNSVAERVSPEVSFEK